MCCKRNRKITTKHKQKAKKLYDVKQNYVNEKIFTNICDLSVMRDDVCMALPFPLWKCCKYGVCVCVIVVMLKT